jgi:hypothetical protein
MGDGEITAIRLTQSQRRKVIPKYGMTQDEVIFAIGSEDLVRRMRAEKWIVPVLEKPLLFDAGAIATAWARILTGEIP